MRAHRAAPAFLHLRTVRLMGHAGSDVEAAYRTPAEIRDDDARDPLLGTARLLPRQAGDADDLVDHYEHKRAEVLEIAAGVRLPASCRRPRPSWPRCASPPGQVGRGPTAARSPIDARAFFDGALPEDEGPLTLAQSINRALTDVLAPYPEAMVFGEDVAAKGGVYGVTRGLLKPSGPARVFDTVLDEQSILGLALGAGVSGLLPIPEIQYLAYLHNAEDQLRGEAASLKFFSQDQYRNPMVLRVAGYGYQKGFGGHFHNDDAVGVLRDIPGLVIASPSRPDDAAAMLRTCVAAAAIDGTVCVFLEPIALYHRPICTRPGTPVAGAVRTAGAVERRARAHRRGADPRRRTDLTDRHVRQRRPPEPAGGAPARRRRASSPCARPALAGAAAGRRPPARGRATGRVLVVDETRRSGGSQRGRPRRAGRRRLRRPHGPGDQPGLLRPARRRRRPVLLSEDEIEAAEHAGSSAPRRPGSRKSVRARGRHLREPHRQHSRTAEVIDREPTRRGIRRPDCAITAIDLQALSAADLVVVGTWTDGMFFFGQRPGRGGRIKDRLPAMAGKQAVTYVTFALEPRHALDKLTEIVRATGAEVIGGMAIRRDDIEGGATDLVERVLEATASHS